ncbi:MAG TPA: redoxin domain-containing protein [Verrucomicrobiae bacterium]|jgi:peroxiredoxin Q/BCP|nr:redoxin domain-containing protein [Verrucomicrobiae bacterium]
MAFAFALISLPAFGSLYEGENAPVFTGHDQDGKRFKLGPKIGKEFVLLYFYSKDDTSGSIAGACALRDRMIELKKRDVSVVGISFDKANSLKRFSFKYNLNFPLLADTCGEITDAYGMRMWPRREMSRPVSVLIDLNGKIARVSDSPDPAVQMREMETALNQLEGAAK